jgi:hypothetical protein
MRTALSRDTLVTGRSQRVLLAATLAGLLRRTSPLGPDRARLLKRRDRLRALPLFIPEIADSQAAKSSAFIESLPRSDPP